MAFEVDSEDRIIDAAEPVFPTGTSEADKKKYKVAAYIMDIFDKILNGGYRGRFFKVYDTYAELKAITGEQFEEAGCVETDQKYRWSVSANDWLPI